MTREGHHLRGLKEVPPAYERTCTAWLAITPVAGGTAVPIAALALAGRAHIKLSVRMKTQNMLTRRANGAGQKDESLEVGREGENVTWVTRLAENKEICWDIWLERRTVVPPRSEDRWFYLSITNAVTAAAKRPVLCQ